MEIELLCEVEFIGGPVDGHIGNVVCPADPYLGVSTALPNEKKRWLDHFGSDAKQLRRKSSPSRERLKERVDKTGKLFCVRSLFRWLHGLTHPCKVPLAVYELIQNGTRLTYEYRGSYAITPKQLKNYDWSMNVITNP